MRQRNGARRIHGAFEICNLNAAWAADPDDTLAVFRIDMRARHADKCAPNLVAAAAFRLVDGSRDRLCEGRHVVDDAFLHATSWFDANADHVNILGADFTYNSTDFGCANVDSDYQFTHSISRRAYAPLVFCLYHAVIRRIRIRHIDLDRLLAEFPDMFNDLIINGYF